MFGDVDESVASNGVSAPQLSVGCKGKSVTVFFFWLDRRRRNKFSVPFVESSVPPPLI